MQFLKLSVLIFLAIILGPIQVSCACNQHYSALRCITSQYVTGERGQPVLVNCKVQRTTRSGQCNEPGSGQSVARYCCVQEFRPRPDGSVDCAQFLADFKSCVPESQH
ncbi:hypothetical protein PTTG_12627 [Puccinia triticina 1-1 BBBD Race 1]|uniref:Uncharacterized protein n=2 Tax=Puccinia triticina TaxID=208348 RepID=A0A180GRR5_PUCT1|nr:uncharacterized protein PtA15_10A149 [Puccinia triticina]OAV95517.1 hypothetical protein PTTG_12627 [Puccinia triticina 1-1 BBBD Race 1]WAQ88730.1 hypothetical protein PtA15_10A149 [Puccinia triticina]